jgi:hypothetical protein
MSINHIAIISNYTTACWHYLTEITTEKNRLMIMLMLRFAGVNAAARGINTPVLAWT